MSTFLAVALDAAVPIWIEQIRRERWSWDEINATAAMCGQVIAEKGDLILYRGKRKGETAKAFNALAKGVACLAFVPGGVTVFGRHYEAKEAVP